jgi:hypothetical protein
VTKSEPPEKALSSDAQPTQVITELRRSYTSKLEEVCFYGNIVFKSELILNLYSICILLFLCIFQSEKRKQELLAQLAAEEQHGHELTKIVRELLPTPKKNANLQRQPRHRRVSLLSCCCFQLLPTD